MDVKLSRYACYLIDTIYKDEILWLSQKKCCKELDKKSVTDVNEQLVEVKKKKKK